MPCRNTVDEVPLLSLNVVLLLIPYQTQQKLVNIILSIIMTVFLQTKFLIPGIIMVYELQRTVEENQDKI